MSINGLEVTDVIVFPVKNKLENNSVKAFARIILNDQLIINGVKILKGTNGLFITFPQEYSEKAQKGYDICFPITAKLRSYISDQVLAQYAICVQQTTDYDRVFNPA